MMIADEFRAWPRLRAGLKRARVAPVPTRGTHAPYLPRAAARQRKAPSGPGDLGTARQLVWGLVDVEFAKRTGQQNGGDGGRRKRTRRTSQKKRTKAGGRKLKLMVPMKLSHSLTQLVTCALLAPERAGAALAGARLESARLGQPKQGRARASSARRGRGPRLSGTRAVGAPPG